jgi:hypothetical protein
MKNEKTNINQHVNECLVSNAILGKKLQPNAALLAPFIGF